MGQLLYTLHHVELARVVFLTSAALGIAAAHRVGPRAPCKDAAVWASRSSAPVRATIALVAGAILAAGWLTPVLVGIAAYGFAFWAWAAALVALVAAGLIWDRGARGAGQGPAARPRWAGGAEVAALVVVVIVAALLRFPGVGSVPPEVHGDEAMFGIAARRVVQGELPNAFGQGDNALGDHLNAIALRLFGDNLQGLRTGSAVFGTLSVLLLYGITRPLFGGRAALLAGWLLAVAQWHIHYSRDGITVIHAAFATTLVIWAGVRAAQSARAFDFALLGLAAALCMHVYYPARIAPIVVALYLGYRCLHEPGFFATRWQGLMTAVVGAGVFLAPFGAEPGGIPLSLVLSAMACAALYAAHRAPLPVVSARRTPIVVGIMIGIAAIVAALVVSGAAPANVMGRMLAVTVLSENNLRHEMAAYHVERPEQVLAIQTIRTLEAFNYSGETSQQYFRRRVPLLDFWTAALLVPGVALVTARALQPSYFLIAAWIWLTLVLGSILTVDAPFSPRITLATPALALAAGLVLEMGWRGAEQCWGRVGQVGARAAVCGVLGLTLVANARDYFMIHINELQPAGFNTAVSREIERVNPGYRVYLISGQGARLDYETEQFLVPNVDGMTVGPAPLTLPLREIPIDKGAAFIIQTGTPVYDERLGQVRAVYPNSPERSVRSARGEILFTTVLVERDQLVSMRQ